MNRFSLKCHHQSPKSLLDSSDWHTPSPALVSCNTADEKNQLLIFSLFDSLLVRMAKTVIIDKTLTSIPPDLRADATVAYFYHNKITSLVAISRVSASLTKLKMWRNPLASLEGVEVLQRLTQLNVSDCCLTSLEPISTMTLLTKLRVRGNRISSLEPISRLSSLVTLSISDNQISSLTPLANLASLSKLQCWSNDISCLEPLSPLTKLTSLWCGGNSITCLSPLSSLTQLRVIFFSDNFVTSLEPLPQLPLLHWIECDCNPIPSLLPLTHVSSLACLAYSRDQKDVAAVKQAFPEMKVQLWPYGRRYRDVRHYCIINGHFIDFFFFPG